MRPIGGIEDLQVALPGARLPRFRDSSRSYIYLIATHLGGGEQLAVRCLPPDLCASLGFYCQDIAMRAVVRCSGIDHAIDHSRRPDIDSLAASARVVGPQLCAATGG